MHTKAAKMYITDLFSTAENSLQSRALIPHVKTLLDSDEYLFTTAVAKVAETQEAINNVAEAAYVLHLCRTQLFRAQATSRSDLFIKALAGQLVDAPVLRELLLAVKKCTSDVLLNVLNEIVPLFIIDETDEADDAPVRIQTDLQALLSENNGNKEPLRSEHDIRNETLRTTVVANKVLLSKHRSNLSEKDVAYSNLVNEFHDWLKSYFEKALQDPSTFFMHEIVLYDLRGPHRAAFTPKTRHAIERALFCPHDYLGCRCCGSVNQDNDGEVS
jgi:origin recognition complex subunit 3